MIKLCEKCKAPVGYNSMFSAYYCASCGYIEDVPDAPDINLGRSFIVQKPETCQNRYVLIVLFKHKQEGKYSWVNFTKGHICPCKFDTVEDAIADLEKYRESGKIINFVETTRVF